MNCYLGNMAKGTALRRVIKKQRALGRSLGDFPDLNEAEKEVIAAAREGRLANFGDKIPETDDERKTRTVRAGLVRFLALGGDVATPVHEHGVSVQGAIIVGELNFADCVLADDLNLWDCELTEAFDLHGAQTRSVKLHGTRCKELDADNAEILGDLSLCQGFEARGSVHALGATITGDFDCSGGQFGGANDYGYVLSCDGIRIDGVLFLCEGFSARGSVRLIGARVGGDVVCAGGKFGATDESKTNNEVANKIVLDLDRAKVGITLWLGSRRDDANFHGGVDLTGAQIGRIADVVTEGTTRLEGDLAPAGGSTTPAFLALDGLVYERFGENTDLTAKARIALLRLQREVDLGTRFKPQPWIQMVKVLRDTGHAEAAREVAIAYEDERRRASVIASGTGRFLHRLYGLLIGYGHRPLQLLRITFSLWLVCGATYFTAAELGVMAPTNPRVFDEAKHEACRPENGGNWTTCAKAPYEYTTFNPWIYSLDLMLPFVDLQQERDWAPMMTRPCAVTKSIGVTDICWQSATVAKAKGESFVAKPAYWISGTIVAGIMWFEILFGWAASLLLAAVLSGLAKKME